MERRVGNPVARSVVFGHASCGERKENKSPGSKLLQQDLSAGRTLHLSINMNGFSNAGDVEDQFIRLAGHRLHQVRFWYTVQAEHNVLQFRDCSREGNEAKAVLFCGLDLRSQVKREGMVAPATGEVGGPNLRCVIPVAGRGLQGIEDGHSAENWSADTRGGHDP